MPETPSPSTTQAAHDPHFSRVVSRLASEFSNVHHSSTVSRCVDAAHHGAKDVTGRATPDLVERIARQHLQVLALAFAEQH
ncbi:three-helix bundle dimerization domain-containing protein [Nocardiopsis alba]|uniref:three-helix bundle dimerization domain-containing protein n=1 Tax=Nocardiopsis alba TaxID=53437 RepID=UPI0033B3ABC6